MQQRLAVCHTCKLKHIAAEGSDEAIEFFSRHQGHVLGLEQMDAGLLALSKITKSDLFHMRSNSLWNRFGLDRIQWPWQKRDYEVEWDFDRLGFANYRGNANVKQAFGGETAFDLTKLNSLASSAVSGWQSQYVNNTSNLYLDALCFGSFASGGTAGGNNIILFFAYGATDTSNFPNTGASSSAGTGASLVSGGVLNFNNITNSQCPLPIVFAHPYLVNLVPPTTPAFSLVAALNQALWPYWGLAILNDAGWTFMNAGNNVTYDPVYYTVI